METSTRRHRSRSRSRSKPRSKSRSRSASVDRRRRFRRSRSGSRSDSRENRHGNASPSPDRRRKKEKKEKKRKHKKEKSKKRHPDSAPSSPRIHDSANVFDAFARANEPDAPAAAAPAPVATKRDFFAQLKHQESGKEMIGTVHASGRKVESATSMLAPGNDNWDCVKPGCSNSNMKKALSCMKCGAMRRISAWR
ncbi:hypothetical protein SPRG_04060 [Saprolegnia parasitica CBS 223.65]|uniref:RanBP2-type domain-containing protein n=1 Tax=Saprolegnia parasitica (strain CBS 223.65) TaxID=695850 RepID=A0A067CQA8_SAPPC|nr:hypothetical protein SPRG_04060 [Saprolegnia parasitica CBS 223.65]KDO31445.1 hypothetical protein SPRG_04060 [Saprolegnia parasitica CBS 223.65]|eukprot:XP_012198040.1 hypothetical protein SPRG_04060 [Saprolegnia parasitica CBS 223.65]